MSRKASSEVSHVTVERLRDAMNYDPLTGIFTQRLCRKGSPIGSKSGSIDKRYGYVHIQLDSRNYMAHRLAWLHFYGEWPIFDIDHINGVRHDNRISNLRQATRQENLQNKRASQKNSSTGLLGVSKKSKNRWEARIGVNGEQIHLGSFETPELAHDAYLNAKRKLHSFCTI